MHMPELNCNFEQKSASSLLRSANVASFTETSGNTLALNNFSNTLHYLCEQSSDALIIGLAI